MLNGLGTECFEHLNSWCTNSTNKLQLKLLHCVPSLLHVLAVYWRLFSHKSIRTNNCIVYVKYINAWKTTKRNKIGTCRFAMARFFLLLQTAVIQTLCIVFPLNNLPQSGQPIDASGHCISVKLQEIFEMILPPGATYNYTGLKLGYISQTAYSENAVRRNS